ncbi:MAG: DUF6817 domain-containing protein [Saccharospirillum sp.]|uniref:DUF6817 domain-containing protein n=1 Tax=Saccharospirillum sp. TaxID=2033801 RepID=UPI003297717A
MTGIMGTESIKDRDYQCEQYRLGISLLKELEYHKHCLYERTHMAHAIETYNLLSKWGEGFDTCLAGLLHSVYSEESGYGNGVANINQLKGYGINSNAVELVGIYEYIQKLPSSHERFFELENKKQFQMASILIADMTDQIDWCYIKNDIAPKEDIINFYKCREYALRYCSREALKYISKMMDAII